MIARRLSAWTLGGVLLCGMASCNFFHSESGSGHSGSQGSSSGSEGSQSFVTQQSTPVVRVRVVRAQEKGMERRTSRPASVHSFQFADLFAKVSGYLEKQQVDIGDHVKKGEELAQIYVPEVWADLERTKASVKKAKADVKVKSARVNAAEANLEQSKIEVEQAKADWRATQATLEFRQEEYARFEKLVKAKAVEAELLDEKREQRKTAEAKEFAARKKINTTEARVKSVHADLVQAKADLEDAQANVEVAAAVQQRAQALADYTKIKSPYTGVVTERFFHEGDFIRDAAQGSGKLDPIFRVARVDLMRVIMYVPDKDAPFVKSGQDATLSVDALPGETFDGKVARIAAAEQYESRTMRIEVDVPNRNGLLRDGMFGTLTINLGRFKGVTIPSPCLTNSQTEGKRAVFVVRDHRAHKVNVEVLADDGIHATVKGPGLEPDDLIVAEHSPGLADGTAVQAHETRQKENKRK